MKTKQFLKTIADWFDTRTAYSPRRSERRHGKHTGLLSLLLIMTLASPSRAEFAYSIQNGAVTLSGYTGPGGDLIVPETIEGSPVTRIGSGAFYGCTNVTTVTIPNRVAGMGEQAFEGCRGLMNMTLPGIPRIGDRAFSGCVSLTNVSLMNGLTQIGNGAFSGCSNLLSLPIPAGVKTIGDWAFSGCERLQTVALSSSIISVGNRAFYGCDSLLAITVEPNNRHYTSADGVLFDTNQTTLVAFPAGRGGSYTIPATVTDFQNGAFSGCNKLGSIQISDGVTRIADGAFSGCGSLTQVTFPTSLARIGYSAYYDCGELAHLTFPASLSEIGNGAFYGCDSLEQAYFEGNAPRADSGLASQLCFEPGRTTFYYLPGSSGWETFGGRRLLWQPQLQARDSVPTSPHARFYRLPVISRTVAGRSGRTAGVM